jgi:hypothetical protein|tara:strand:+ start:452 stop:757 length:306 start_codon:yes stop_codon:yes gene_type:complete
MPSKKSMYRVLPSNGIWTNRNVSEVVNGMMNGKINATGTIVMNGIIQTLTDERIAIESVILFTARANAQFGLPYVKVKRKGEAVIGYEGTTPATFDYVVLG